MVYPPKSPVVYPPKTVYPIGKKPVLYPPKTVYPLGKKPVLYPPKKGYPLIKKPVAYPPKRVYLKPKKPVVYPPKILPKYPFKKLPPVYPATKKVRYIKPRKAPGCVFKVPVYPYAPCHPRPKRCRPYRQVSRAYCPKHDIHLCCKCLKKWKKCTGNWVLTDTWLGVRCCYDPTP